MLELLKLNKPHINEMLISILLHYSLMGVILVHLFQV